MFVGSSLDPFPSSARQQKTNKLDRIKLQRHRSVGEPWDGALLGPYERCLRAGDPHQLRRGSLEHMMRRSRRRPDRVDCQEILVQQHHWRAEKADGSDPAGREAGGLPDPFGARPLKFDAKRRFDPRRIEPIGARGNDNHRARRRLRLQVGASRRH
jgi:hypothetical protein